jgi:DinB superfamily
MEKHMSKNVNLQQFGFQRLYLALLVDDIPEEQMTRQPGGVVNHPAWHLGHLAFVANRFATILGCASNMDPSWEGKFAPNTTPSPDRSVYPVKAELIRILDDRRGALANAYEQASESDLAKPNPNARLAANLPTVEHLIAFGMVFHEATHLGQLASWRKAAGMPTAFSKLPR